MNKQLVALLAAFIALSFCITTSAQSPAGSEPAAGKPAVKGSPAKEPVQKETVTKEPAANKPVAKEPVKKEPAAKEPAADKPKKNTAKEPVKKEPDGGKEFRAVEALKSSGFKACAEIFGEVLKFLHKRDDFAYINTWNEKKSADMHTASIFTVKTYSDGNSYASVTVSPRANGGCDAGFTQVFFFFEACSIMRDTSFKDWKLNMEYNEVSIYEDPTSKNVVISLTPTANGCLVVKNGTFYFPPKAK
jgi:hypothetical protein